MAVTLVSKIVARGQLANAQASIYSPSSGQSVIGVKMRVYNTNTTLETVSVFVRKSGDGTSSQIATLALEASSSGVVDVGILGDGDDLRAFTTTASKVDYAVFGTIKS